MCDTRIGINCYWHIVDIPLILTFKYSLWKLLQYPCIPNVIKLCSYLPFLLLVAEHQLPAADSCAGGQPFHSEVNPSDAHTHRAFSANSENEDKYINSFSKYYPVINKWRQQSIVMCSFELTNFDLICDWNKRNIYDFTLWVCTCKYVHIFVCVTL